MVRRRCRPGRRPQLAVQRVAHGPGLVRALDRAMLRSSLRSNVISVADLFGTLPMNRTSPVRPRSATAIATVALCTSIPTYSAASFMVNLVDAGDQRQRTASPAHGRRQGRSYHLARRTSRRSHIFKAARARDRLRCARRGACGPMFTPAAGAQRVGEIDPCDRRANRTSAVNGQSRDQAQWRSGRLSGEPGRQSSMEPGASSKALQAGREPRLGEHRVPDHQGTGDLLALSNRQRQARAPALCRPDAAGFREDPVDRRVRAIEQLPQSRGESPPASSAPTSAPSERSE